MLTFVLRRTLATFLVLLAASFVVYLLTAYSGNPLADLIGSRDPNREELIAERIRELNLETPVPLRYFSWLAGVGGCFIGQCDLGQSYVTNQEVTAALEAAVPETLSLVTAATFIAIILGIAVGMVSALRQYSGFDYTITFITFVLYSLPVFWVAVLLKEWGAIREGSSGRPSAAARRDVAPRRSPWQGSSRAASSASCWRPGGSRSRRSASSDSSSSEWARPRSCCSPRAGCVSART